MNNILYNRIQKARYFSSAIIMVAYVFTSILSGSSLSASCGAFKDFLNDNNKSFYISFECYPPSRSMPVPFDSPLTNKLMYEGFWSKDGYRSFQYAYFQGDVRVTNFFPVEYGRYKGTNWDVRQNHIYFFDKKAEKQFNLKGDPASFAPNSAEEFLLTVINCGLAPIGTNNVEWSNDNFKATDIYGVLYRGAIVQIAQDRPVKMTITNIYTGTFSQLSFDYESSFSDVVPSTVRIGRFSPTGDPIMPMKFRITKLLKKETSVEEPHLNPVLSYPTNAIYRYAENETYLKLITNGNWVKAGTYKSIEPQAHPSSTLLIMAVIAMLGIPLAYSMLARRNMN